MRYLYGYKKDAPQLVATFSGEPQLRAYVRWATLATQPDGTSKFEQGSVLIGARRWSDSPTPQTDDDPESVPHNPTPSML
jgi:hypothetical protein